FPRKNTFRDTRGSDHLKNQIFSGVSNQNEQGSIEMDRVLLAVHVPKVHKRTPPGACVEAIRVPKRTGRENAPLDAKSSKFGCSRPIVHRAAGSVRWITSAR